MPDPREVAREVQFEVQRDFLRDPFKLYPIFLRPYRLQILMVTDDSASFGRADFGLSALLDALSVAPGPWVRFDVTKAHRRFDPAADIAGFRFDTTDLSQFNQIWMFAVERTGSEISDAELAAISRFMDDGGGVFATGDHEDLGVAMCGSIPRVRSMRKWHWPAGGPNGEPVAPHVDGPDRLDTLSAGGDSGVQFDDQSDDVPQVIWPRYYSSWPSNHYFHRAHPHPLLCGPRGVIRRMPDHPHEGECYVPTDLSATFTFGGYAITEYPGGLAPEVVAHSRSPYGRQVTDVKGLLNGRQFGSIGAYDGHRVDVGRVVVDSTWHHFFDVNLVGELGNQSPVKSVGFDASASGHEAYEDIKSYFRNIAIWLASEDAQRAMWFRALWWARWHHRLAMDIRPPFLEKVVDLDLPELVRIGSEARDALGRVASQCTVRWWIIWHVIRPRPKLWPDLGPIIDPWHPKPPLPDPPPDLLNRPVPDIAAGIHGEILLDAVLGAAIYSIADRYRFAGDEERKQAEDDDFDELIAENVEHALRAVAKHVDEQGRGLADMAERLRGGGREDAG